MNRGRLQAFSDGVIAVAITLLALNLAVEGPGHGPLVQQLADRWPVFVAYLISFFIAVAFISPQFALAIVGLTAIYYMFERGAAGAR